MSQQGSGKVWGALMWVFCGAYALVVAKVLFGDSYHNYVTVALLVCAAAALGVMALAYRCVARYSRWLEGHYGVILGGFAGVYFLCVAGIGLALRFTPTFDFDAVYGGAVQWLREGSFADYYDYYSYFPNNLGGMVTLHGVFSVAALLGFADHFAVGTVFNALLITASGVLISLVCAKLAGKTAGCMALVVFAMHLPFWVMGAAFYTDSLSMPFPILFYYLYLRGREQTQPGKKALYITGMALALAVGCLIKFTVLIVLIAVLMEVLLRRRWKEAAGIAGAAILAVALAFGAMNSCVYTHLDRARSEELKTPYLHWVMMGLRDNGTYNPGDYEYTRSFPAQEREAACLERIQERLGEMKFSGFTQLLLRKATVSLGDGTLAVSDFLDDGPVQEHWLHRYVLYGGEHYAQYQHMTTGFLLALYVLMILGGAPKGPRAAPGDTGGTLAPYMAVLGILAFLLLWETSGRYVTNFMPLFHVCAVLGLVRMMGKPDLAVKPGPRHKKKGR